MTTGERLHQLRTGKNVTMKEMADAIQVTQSTIYKYENGVVKTIPQAKLYAIAEYLETTVSFLLGIDEDNGFEYVLTLNEQIMLDQYRHLDLINQKTVNVLIERLLQAQEEDGKDEQLLL
jgi:transcriptional regulator with XRE-family HTH domain